MRNQVPRPGVTFMAYLAMAFVYVVAFVLLPIIHALHIHAVDITDAGNITIFPAPFTFDAWDVVFAGLATYAYTQRRLRWVPVQLKIARPFWIVSAMYILWFALLQYGSLPLSTVAMAGMLVASIVIYRRIVEASWQEWATPLWNLRVPFSLWLGWTCVMMVYSASTTLAATHWDGFGINPVYWGMAMLILLTVITLGINLLRVDIPFTLIIIWTLYGISIQQETTPLIFRTAQALTAGLTVFLFLRYLYSDKGVRMLPSWLQWMAGS